MKCHNCPANTTCDAFSLIRIEAGQCNYLADKVKKLQAENERLTAELNKATMDYAVAAGDNIVINELREKLKTAVLEEREACAKVCDEVYQAGRLNGAQDCAAAIRGRK